MHLYPPSLCSFWSEEKSPVARANLWAPDKVPWALPSRSCTTTSEPRSGLGDGGYFEGNHHPILEALRLLDTQVLALAASGRNRD